MQDKIIVSNREALLKKYGKDGFDKIVNALDVLIDADNKRGIKSKVIYLDDKVTMTKIKGKAVLNVFNSRENKESIDSIFKSFNPHYLMILGGPDIVPHQDVDNPVFSSGDDEDEKAWSDLPYACDAPYSRDPSKFVGPTRVVGRVPDLVGATEPSYLLTLLKNISNSKRLSQEEYSTSYMGLSAEVWQGSTNLSLTNIFGSSEKLLLAPPSGPSYPGGELRNRMHFINCHGGPASPEFYGQKGSSYPISMTSQSTTGEIIEGTVAAVECCYGAELYDSVTLSIDQPICQSYLLQGGYGYFGSTTIAYGPSDGNGAADLICQYFLQKVLQGASTGEAALTARQLYSQSVAQMDAVDLKTLNQFYLLGDPSVHPIGLPTPTELPLEIDPSEAERFFRSERRQKMRMTGDFLKETKPTSSKKIPIGKLSSNTKKALSNIAKLAGLNQKQKFTAFAVKKTQIPKEKDMKISATPSRYLIAIGTPEGEPSSKIKIGVAVVAKELKGRIIGYRIYHQR